MKAVILLIIPCIIFASCDDDDITPAVVNNSVNTNLAPELFSQGGLRISEMIEEGENKTAEFNPYLFVFASNGVVTATLNGQVNAGTYLLFQDDGQTELLMNFPNSPALFELNDDWYKVSSNNGVLRFNDSGDILEFQPQ